MKKKKRIILSLSAILQSFLFAFLLTIGIGYAIGYRAFLVNGWSSEPEIMYQSLVINYKQSQNDLYQEFSSSHDINGNVFTKKENGKNIYVTFSTDGKSFTTHTIVAMKPEGEYFEKGEEVRFDNMGITFVRTVGKKCQIITMTNNESSYQPFITDIKNNSDGVSNGSNGPGFEQNEFKDIYGRVLYSFEKVGQILFFARNNFMQIVVYVIILYIANEIIKFVPAYIKNY